MFVVTMREGVRVRKPQAPGKERKRIRVGGHGVRLLIMHHLNVVLDRPEQSVAVGKDAGFLMREQMMARETRQNLERGTTAQIGELIPMRQLQILNDELHVPDGAFA